MGDVSRHPGASNMLGVWENVKLRTWCSDARGEQRAERNGSCSEMYFPCHNMNCLPH